MMSTLEPVHGLAPSHPSLTGASYSPNLAPPNLSSMSRGIASGRSSPFSSSESLQYTPSPNGPDLNLGLPSSSPFDGALAPQSVTAPPVQRTSDASLHFTSLHHSNSYWLRQRYTVRWQLLNTDTSHPFAHRTPSTLASRLPSGQRDWDEGALEACTTSDRRAWARPSDPRRTPAHLAAQLSSPRACHLRRTPR
jgi:hypothetical protein